MASYIHCTSSPSPTANADKLPQQTHAVPLDYPNNESLHLRSTVGWIPNWLYRFVFSKMQFLHQRLRSTYCSAVQFGSTYTQWFRRTLVKVLRLRLPLWPLPRQFRGELLPRTGCVQIIPAEPDESVHVMTVSDTVSPWQLGFFGKGSLSRGEPTWWRRHHEPTKTAPREGMSSERRAHALAVDRERIVSGVMEDPEVYRLMMEEAIYLADEIECLQLSEGGVDLDAGMAWKRCRSLRQPNGPVFDSSEFAIQYAAYHYYRTRGWVVKSGHLFGAHFVLYRKGPTHRHSEYAVLIIPVFSKTTNSNSSLAVHDYDRPTWQSVQMSNRVCSHAKKRTLLCHVVVPSCAIDLDDIRCIERMQIWDVSVGRWKPEKSRK
ncbi:hypothetical protein BASA50_002733 [Batrachochytrium salamandrivorans]|uniref:tRNA-intron lyase n=1 Tax=Batrachochytrium salamandrivorans TaxID=1357716 RepID=A0ABQ8FKH7_9FUNG|nr:hypothetical protein BASA62_004693 [Batrachochytrium salamandrivorans]KAH6577664.1 hypothetical protein BASA60_003926 [Batrachochytrium salamandrivorans]KAH6599862.1 hypothetical protein BASA50_002733 [Batrachochytrium salamandrivorans]KAH9248899.1 hypothetical protein BASA81_013411 [Batrachochytrium salamandrivorans]